MRSVSLPEAFEAQRIQWEALEEEELFKPRTLDHGRHKLRPTLNMQERATIKAEIQQIKQERPEACDPIQKQK